MSEKEKKTTKWLLLLTVEDLERQTDPISLAYGAANQCAGTTAGGGSGDPGFGGQTRGRLRVSNGSGFLAMVLPRATLGAVERFRVNSSEWRLTAAADDRIIQASSGGNGTEIRCAVAGACLELRCVANGSPGVPAEWTVWAETPAIGGATSAWILT